MHAPGANAWRGKSLFLSKQAAAGKQAELSDAEHLRERLVRFVGLADALMLGQLCELLRLGVELFKYHIALQRKQVRVRACMHAGAVAPLPTCTPLPARGLAAFPGSRMHVHACGDGHACQAGRAPLDHACTCMCMFSRQLAGGDARVRRAHGGLACRACLW